MSEPDVSDLVDVVRAMEIIDAADVSPRVIPQPLARAAGRVLAKAIVADRDYPPFDKSLMDGFAVRSADADAAFASLKLVGEIAAGARSNRPLGAGEAMAIMTGAPLPPHADAVIPIEFTRRDGDGRVILDKNARPGAAVARRASDVARGEIVLPAGSVLSAAQLAVAATVGATRLDVFEPPRAVVLATGEEIVPIDSQPADYQIRNANNVLLSTLVRQLGAAVEREAHAGDDRDKIAAAIADSADATLLFVSGGMSMGQYDFVPQALRDAGYELRISKVKLRPGKPFVFGVHPEGRFVFGLPGNPVSAFVCTLVLASRLIRRMIGLPPAAPPVNASLSTDLPANGEREFFQPARRQDGAIVPLKWKSSGDVFTLASADALIRRPINDPSRVAGDIVQLLEIPS